MIIKKSCLIDTNIVSDYLKGFIKIEKKKLQWYSNKVDFYIPTLTFAELNGYNDLIEKLINISKLIKVYIHKPYNLFIKEEIKTISSDINIRPWLIDLSYEVEKNENEMRKYFLSTEFIEIVKGLEKIEVESIENINKMVMENDYKNEKEFIEGYLWTQLGMMDQVVGKKIIYSNNLNRIYNLNSLVVQGSFLYRKFINKGIKVVASDVFDGLIISTVPYADIFITEKQNAGILKEMKREISPLKGITILKYGDLRRISS